MKIREARAIKTQWIGDKAKDAEMHEVTQNLCALCVFTLAENNKSHQSCLSRKFYLIIFAFSNMNPIIKLYNLSLPFPQGKLTHVRAHPE